MSDEVNLATLKETVLGLTYTCPKGPYSTLCPFGILKGLSHESRNNLLGRMSREELLRLFDLTSPCVCPVDPRLELSR